MYGASGRITAHFHVGGPTIYNNLLINILLSWTDAILSDN